MKKNYIMRFNVALQTWLHGGGRMIQAKASGKLYKVKSLQFEPKLLLIAYDENEEIEREPEYFMYPAICEKENTQSCKLPPRNNFKSPTTSIKEKRVKILKKHRVLRRIKKIGRRLRKGLS
jgi:hypothetical protein